MLWKLSNLPKFHPQIPSLSSCIVAGTSIPDFHIKYFTSLPTLQQYSIIKEFTREEVDNFLRLTGDANSIHVSSEAAKATTGVAAPILPGILMASMFPAIIGTHFPGTLYLSQTLKFRQTAQVGVPIHAIVSIEKQTGRKVIFNTQCRLTSPSREINDDQTAILVEGQALALLPPANNS